MFLIKQLYYQRYKHILTILANSVAVFLLLSVKTFSDYLIAELNKQLIGLAVNVETIQIINDDLSEKQINLFFDEKRINTYCRFYMTDYDEYDLISCDNLNKLFTFKFLDGEFFSDWQINSNNNVAVIGYNLINYFDNISVGEMININGGMFEVIGILDKDTSNLFFDGDNSIFIPIDYHFNDGKRQYMFLSDNIINEDEINKYLNKNDYILISQKEIQQSMQLIASITEKILMALSFVSVIVSFIGIINNSLSSLHSRKQEIGIKKAMGATDKDIYWQFILETVIIIFISLFVAFMALMLVITLLKIFFSFEIYISYEECAGILVLVIFLSIVCGMYPAFLAGKITVISAIRN